MSNLANARFGTFGQFYDAAGLVGLAAPVLVVVVLVVYARGPHARSWGTEVRTWLLAYPTYVMAGSGVAPAMLRYCSRLPALIDRRWQPEPGTTPSRKVWLVIVSCLVGIALQWWWIDTLLIVRQQQNTPWMP